MRILITGAGQGFIGTALSLKCLKLGHKVFYTGKEEGYHIDGKYLGYDFHNLDFKFKPDVVIHCASITDTMIHDATEMKRVNTEYSKKLFLRAIDSGVKSIVYASSAAVYGRYKLENNKVTPFTEDDPLDPLNEYGESKALLDEFSLSLMKEMPYVKLIGLRYSNVYGGRMESHKGKCASMVWQVFKTIKQGKVPVLFKWGYQSRDYVFIDDVVNANMLCAFENVPSGVYNIGAGKMWSFNEIVKLVNNRLGTKSGISYVDNPISKYYQDYNLLDISKAKAVGYSPEYDLKKGINKIFKQ